jgi:hypothetical protein
MFRCGKNTLLEISVLEENVIGRYDDERATYLLLFEGGFALAVSFPEEENVDQKP